MAKKSQRENAQRRAEMKEMMRIKKIGSARHDWEPPDDDLITVPEAKEFTKRMKSIVENARREAMKGVKIYRGKEAKNIAKQCGYMPPLSQQKGIKNGQIG